MKSLRIVQDLLQRFVVCAINICQWWKPENVLKLILMGALSLPALADDCHDVAGNGLRFDGVDDFVDFGAGPWFYQHTMEAWVKPTGLTGTTQFILGPEGSSFSGCHYGATFAVVEPTSGSTLLTYTLGPTGCGNDVALIAPLDVLNDWYHLAGTFDGSTMRFYVNGGVPQDQ